MIRITALTLGLAAASLGVSASQLQPAPQVITGRVSDSICGASHLARAGTMTGRQCIFECLKALATWVLVDEHGSVIPIANYDLPGLPLYAGRPVRLTGHFRDGEFVASAIEAYPPHLHLLHVMTNWRDTPGGVGLLIAALSDAKTASAHAELAVRGAGDLAQVQLHAGHVLHALAPETFPKGPGSGYGVRKAASGARHHLGLAVQDGASSNVKDGAARVLAAIAEAEERMGEAASVAQSIRASASAEAAAVLTAQLDALTGQTLARLTQAHAEMTRILEGEGLRHAPR